MQKTTFARITSNGLEEHIIKDHITLECLNKRLIYKNHKEQYFRIYDDERIYTSTHSTHKSYDYILGKNLDSDILKDLTLVAGTAEEDIITISSGTVYKTSDGTIKPSTNGTLPNINVSFPKCPENHNRCATIIQYNFSRYNGWFGGDKDEYGSGGQIIGLQSLLCYPNNSKALCSSAVESSVLYDLYTKYNTQQQMEKIKPEVTNKGPLPVVKDFWSTNFGKDLSQVIHSKKLPKYLSTGTMNAWLSNYNGSISDGSSMRERINDNEFTYWPCGFNKDPISGEEVAMCQDGTGKIYGTVCDSSKTEFCLPAWETLQYNPNAPTNSETFNSGSNNMFGLCYNPTDTSAAALCSTDKANMAPITKMFNPILYAKQEAKYKAQQIAIKKANKKAQEKFISTMIQIALAVTGLDMYPLGMALSIAAAYWVHDYTGMIISGTLFATAKIYETFKLLNVTENIVDGGELENLVPRGDERESGLIENSDLDETNLAKQVDIGAADPEAENVDMLKNAADDSKIRDSIMKRFPYINSEELEMIINNKLSRLNIPGKTDNLDAIFSAGTERIGPEEEAKIHAAVRETGYNKYRGVMNELNMGVNEDMTANTILQDGREKGALIDPLICDGRESGSLASTIPSLTVTGCDDAEIAKLTLLQAEIDAREELDAINQALTFTIDDRLNNLSSENQNIYDNRINEWVQKRLNKTRYTLENILSSDLYKAKKTEIINTLYEEERDAVYTAWAADRSMVADGQERPYYDIYKKKMNLQLTDDWLDRLQNEEIITSGQRTELLKIRYKFSIKEYDVKDFNKGIWSELANYSWEAISEDLHVSSEIYQQLQQKLFAISILDVRIQRFAILTSNIEDSKIPKLLKDISEMSTAAYQKILNWSIDDELPKELLHSHPSTASELLPIIDEIYERWSIDKLDNFIRRDEQGDDMVLLAMSKVRGGNIMSRREAREIADAAWWRKLMTIATPFIVPAIASLAYLLVDTILKNSKDSKNINNANGKKSNLDENLKIYNNLYNKNKTQIKNLQTGINTISKPNKVPVQLYNYILNNDRIGTMSSINFGVEINNNKLQTTVKPGQKINSQISQNTSFSLEGNKMDNKQMDYDTNLYFSEPYIRNVLQKQGIHQILQNTTAAYKKLASLGFDMPFNPFQTPAYPDNAANIGTNLYDGSFVGGTDDIKLSQKWWNNWLGTTRIITISNNDCATKNLPFLCDSSYMYNVGDNKNPCTLLPPPSKPSDCSAYWRFIGPSADNFHPGDLYQCAYTTTSSTGAKCTGIPFFKGIPVAYGNKCNIIPGPSITPINKCYSSNISIAPVFNNKYIQFMSMSQTYQPTTTCSSFCSLFGAKVNTADTNFNNNLKTLKNICPLNPTDSPDLKCYKCYDNTDEENADSKWPNLKCKDLGSNSCTNLEVAQRCPWTCKKQSGCTTQNDTYVVNKNSGGPIGKVDCYTETGLKQCGKTCGVCHNIINSCNCYYPAPTPNPKSIYIGKSPVPIDYILSNYFNTTWNLLGKNAWWYKETGLSDTSCICTSDIDATLECQKCGVTEVSSCHNVDIKKCENHYIYNDPTISSIKGYFRCIFDSCSNVCVPNKYRCGGNNLTNLSSSYKKSMNNSCKTIPFGDTEISYKYIYLGKTPISKNTLQLYPINCNQFCQMKSLLGYEKNNYTYYGIQRNDPTLCTCSTSPMNCQSCILKAFPLSEGGSRISNCNDYCRVLHLGEQHRDGYHIFGECGNSAGSSYDNITNCCNCFMYDSKNEVVKVLNNIRDDECKHCGKYKTPYCESLTSRDISMNIKCRDYYEETGEIDGKKIWASCRDNTNSKSLCVKGPDCNITLSKQKCGTIQVQDQMEQSQDCTTVKLRDNEECYFYYNVDDSYKYHCIQDPNDTKKCIEPPKRLSCLDDPNYSYHSSALRGCDPNVSGKALPLVLPPRPAPFPGHLGPTPAPGSWPKENYMTCPTLSADIISTFMCTNYCNNSKIPNNIKGYNCKKYCPEASCNNTIRYYNDREVCAGPIIKPLRGANYDCSFNYNVLQNSCNAFVVEPSSLYGFKQCFFTPSSECIASDELCKLPDRVDDTETPIQPIGSEPTFQADYLHHFCTSSPDRSLQAIATLDWTSDNFKIQALNRLTKPLYGTNGVLSTGNRGGICDVPTPVSLPLPTTTICAKDFSHAFMWNTSKGTITCNNNSDCKNFDPCYNCYRQSGVYCTTSGYETREKVCRATYNISADISYINNVLTISCDRYTRPNFSSKTIYCLPEPTVELKSLPTCFGKTWLNTTGDASGLPIYASIDLGISGQDYCNYLEPPAGRMDGSLCGGYYNWDQEDTGIQCYWNNDSSRCVWAIDNNISTVAFCKTPKESICYTSKYTEPYTSRSDLSICIGPFNLVIKDCCYAVALSKSDGSLCAGFVKDTCNNIYKQCIYNSDISKCDISSSKHPNSISCNKAITRKYLGYSENPSICSNQQPVNTTYDNTDSSKCLAFYTLPDKKPRLFDINYLDASMFGDAEIIPMWYSINKSWYDNSTHTVECVGEPSQHSTSTSLSECASDCHNSSKCSGFWSSATTNSKGPCGLCITKVPKCGYNKTLSCESLTLNDNTNCSNYYKFGKASTEGQNNATMCIPNKKDKNKCQSSFIICNDSNDYISDNCNNGLATINIRRKISGKDNMIDKYTYYSKVPEIWVSKDVPYAYAPYDCSEDTPGWPNKTGFVCQEQPVNGSCVAAIETKEISGHFCKPNILPVNLNNRTCLLQPTPAPISPIFNDMSLGWNMIPYRESGSGQSWPKNQCVQASVMDTVAGNYDFDTEASCNANMKQARKCTRTLGERCIDPSEDCSNGGPLQCAPNSISCLYDHQCNNFDNIAFYCPNYTGNAEGGQCIGADPSPTAWKEGHCEYYKTKPTYYGFSHQACGEGLTCYGTDTISRADGQLLLCDDNATECRCGYSSATGGNVFDVPNNNGTQSCDDYCYSGVNGGVPNSKCLYGYDNNKKKSLPCSSTDSSNITCTCQQQTPWASAFDNSISLTTPQECKRLIYHSCSAETNSIDLQSLGFCKAGVCGQGLTCIDANSLRDDPYKLCKPGTSSDCVCLPINKLTMKSDINRMFPNDPPQQQICEFKSDIPPLHQRCCKDLGVEGKGTTYDYTKQLCCDGVLHDISGLNSQCCGTIIIDTSSHFCCNDIPHMYSELDVSGKDACGNKWKQRYGCLECTNNVKFKNTQYKTSQYFGLKYSNRFKNYPLLQYLDSSSTCSSASQYTIISKDLTQHVSKCPDTCPLPNKDTPNPNTENPLTWSCPQCIDPKTLISPNPKGKCELVPSLIYTVGPVCIE